MSEQALPKWENVKVEFEDGIAWVTLNRPEKRNAMSPALNREMLGVLDALEIDDRCKVLVLTGAGESFSAGMDIKEYFREVDKATPVGVQRVQRAIRFRYAAQARHHAFALRHVATSLVIGGHARLAHRPRSVAAITRSA